MLDNLFEIQVIEIHIMLNVKVACYVMNSPEDELFQGRLWPSQSYLAWRQPDPYSFFFEQTLHLCNTFVHIIPELASPKRQELWFLQSPSGGAGWKNVATTCWTLCLSESEKKTLEAASSYRSCSAYCQAQGGGCISVVSESMAMAIHGDPVIRWPSMCKSL